MIIAVNTRYLWKNKLEGWGYFIQEVFRELALRHPEHQFYFIFDRPFDPQFIFSENVHGIVAGPPARHPLLWKYWYDLKIPRVLRRIRADVFVSPDGFASLRTRVPQCIVVHDLGFLHQPEAYQSSHLFFYKRYMARFLQKAASIATVSQFSRDDIMQQYRVPEAKIKVVYSAVKDGFRSISYDEKEEVKQRWTEGREYFIYIGALQPRKNLVALLKAFSIFKKRQQSAMKLVLAGRLAWKNDAFLELLKTYKFRNDVVLTGYVEEDELARLAGAAYALVYPSLFEGFGVPVLEGMKAGVPVLTSEKSSMAEIGGDAALYFNPRDHKDMADAMMRIYKDETLRSQLVERGITIAAQYSWSRTASLVWEAIEAAVS